LNDTVHVIYQVVKGGDFAIRATITDPDKNIVFSQEDAPFGWYDEEHANVSGTKSTRKYIRLLFDLFRSV
jgi:hypothetical protein